VNTDSVPNKSYLQFRAFLFSQFVTLIGSELTAFALPIWVFEKTQSNTYLSYMSLATILPRVLLGPYAGAVVDSRSPQKIILLADLSQALTIGFVLVNVSYFSEPRLDILLAASLFAGIASTFHYPALAKLLPLLTSPDQLTRANADLSLVERSSQLLGPSLAGVLMTAIGVRHLLLLDLTSFLIATSILWFGLKTTTISENQEVRGLGFWRKSSEGIKLVLKNARLATLLILSSFSNFCFTLSFAFLPAFLLSLGMEKRWIGAFYSIGAGGQIIGNLLVGRVLEPPNLIKAEFKGTFLMVLGGFFLIASSRTPEVVALGYLITMTILPVLNVWNRSSWYQQTSAELQGRVFATRRAASSALGAVGFALGGPVLDNLVRSVEHPSTAYRIAFLATGTLMLLMLMGGWILLQKNEVKK
jgi:DHA3 family macrolide efflux protein-like MFS transporter